MRGKAWTDKREYRQLKHELCALSRDAFADRVLELLRIWWPECIASPPQRTIDQQGIDLYVWNDGQPLSLAVQCKGFEVAEERLEKPQALQCLRSIEKFCLSEARTERYVLIYNREGRDENFRLEVEAAVAELRESGRVPHAELWNVQRLLREVFNGMSRRIRAALEDATERDVGSWGPDDVEPLPVVPVRTSQLVIDRHRLTLEDNPVKSLADPALLLSRREGLTLLIGEAGYGKTTAARRAVSSANETVFFVPAARINDRVVGTKDLLAVCIDIDELLADVGDLTTSRYIARPVLEQLFKDANTNALLIVDGLDESPFFARERGGFQHFFNFFNHIRIPVVLTARTEFWRRRKDDLQQSFGKVGEHKGGIRKHVRQIELVAWNETQMVALAARYRDTLTDDTSRTRINELLSALESGAYETFYGDIPRRPLFLRMILDTVAARDLHRVRRADLLLEWARLKVERDIHESRRWGTTGRPPIATEIAARDTMELSFEAMEAAAHLMVEVHDGTAIFLPECEIRAITNRVPALANSADHTGLVLNSLLVPVELPATERPRVCFAHRLFQEFFLARYLAAHPSEFSDITLPNVITSFLREMT